MNGSELLQSLSQVPWKVAAKTYGNDHSTLIGLMVQWWINLDVEAHTALEGGPAFGYRKRGQGGGGQCDALLCRGKDPIGVLEIEGTRPEYTVNKIGNFFAAEYAELDTLQFGVVLVYALSLIHI